MKVDIQTKTTEQRTMGEEELCQICYATELSPENSMIICWNEHTICSDCCNGIYNSGRSIKCPFDRGYMFDWRPQQPRRASNQPGPHPMADPAIAILSRAAPLVPHAIQNYNWLNIHNLVTITLRNNQIRGIDFRRTCSVCGFTDHTKRNCSMRADDYQDYDWYKPNTRLIRQEKGLINLQEGKTWDNQTRQIVTDSAKAIKDSWFNHRRKLRRQYRAISHGQNPAHYIGGFD